MKAEQRGLVLVCGLSFTVDENGAQNIQWKNPEVWERRGEQGLLVLLEDAATGIELPPGGQVRIELEFTAVPQGSDWESILRRALAAPGSERPHDFVLPNGLGVRVHQPKRGHPARWVDVLDNDAPDVARWTREADTEDAGGVGELGDEQDREEDGGRGLVGGHLAGAMASSAQVPADDPLGDLRALAKALEESLKPHREHFESHLGNAAGHRFEKAEQMREYAELLDWVLHRLDEKLAGPTGKPATLVFKPNTAGEAGVFRFRERGQRAGAASRIVPPDLRLD